MLMSHQRSLRGMCWNYLRDSEAVEDVLQDTFCQVLERAPAIGGDRDVGAWMHRVAANLCIDELRRRARRARAHVGGEMAEAAMRAVADLDPSVHPETALESDATRQSIRAAIRALPVRQREVLIRRDVMGDSEAQVAASLGISTGSVQGLLHRAREAFKDAYLGLARDDAMPVECGQVAFVFEHLRLASLRKDRLRTVERHLAECPLCDARFGAAVTGSGALPTAAA
ncbi:MAG TPA: hypothetical protein DEG26_04895 [Chloroflexi bacterium]|nr:hypothetical protein [Chloroflexota bacterium]